MRVNTNALRTLSQGELLDAVLPCQVTPNFFRLMIATAEALEKNNGEVLAGEADFLPFLSKLADGAVTQLDPSQLGVELAMLRAHELRHDVRPEMARRLIDYKPLDITDALKVTLRAAYMAILHKVLFDRKLLVN